jgi:hypothetical protein
VLFANIFFEFFLFSTRQKNARDENKALLQLFPVLVAHFQSIQMITNSGGCSLLFLPCALSRHVNFGHEPSAKTLQVFRCQQQTITETLFSP